MFHAPVQNLGTHNAIIIANRPFLRSTNSSVSRKHNPATNPLKSAAHHRPSHRPVSPPLAPVPHSPRNAIKNIIYSFPECEFSPGHSDDKSPDGYLLVTLRTSNPV